MATMRDKALETTYAALIVIALFSSLQAQLLTVNSCSGGINGNLDAQTTVTAQNLDNVPYATQISNQIYTAGSTITVTLVPLLDSARTYQEFIIQARLASASVDIPSTPVGTFILVNGVAIASNADFIILNCNNGAFGSTLATANANSKTLPVTGVTFTYQAPNSAVGAIQFVFTIVQQPTAFYERITSQAFDIPTAGPGPVISSCPGNIVQPAESAIRFIFVAWDEPVSSGIGDSTNQDNPNGFVEVGTSDATLFTYQYSTGGLTNECTFSVLVPNIINPIITSCPAVDTIIVNNVGTTERQFTYTLPSCSEVGGGVLPVTCTPASGTVVSNTVNSISCTCSIAGNIQASCTSNNIVVANNPPQIAPCPSNTQAFDVAGNQAVYVYTPPTCTDSNGDVTTVSCNPPPSTVVSVADQIVCTCTDTSGLTDVCTIPVPVTNTPPGAPDCPPGGLTVTTVGTTATATYGPFVCNDAEQGSITAQCVPDSGSAFTLGGNNVVTCTCIDNGNLQSSCNFVVNVVDTNTGPSVPECPSFPFMVSVSVGSNSAVADYGIILCADVQQGSIAATCQPAAGSLFSIGSNVVRCTCVDSGNLTSNCVFNVIVQETPEKFPIWFVLVPSAAFFFGMVLLVSVILVLKRHKTTERRQSDDIPMGATTNTSRSTDIEDESYTDLKNEPTNSSYGGKVGYTGILPQNGTPGYTTSIQNPSGKMYSKNIYNEEKPYHAIE
ncbi:hypothetical protein HOLleu_21153 [Holothuria leucospilota]|uniref:HYR domain-containing protein n=1 Tax=Holothuria leucospilota TaxID=206669 RepID=A0A9Q1BXJ0_HOLLE|nr:hypothetical protein HOLleu_21153 [Holothuria leucospilota]